MPSFVCRLLHDALALISHRPASRIAVNVFSVPSDEQWSGVVPSQGFCTAYCSKQAVDIGFELG
jgi:hypothetical protein